MHGGTLDDFGVFNKNPDSRFSYINEFIDGKATARERKKDHDGQMGMIDMNMKDQNLVSMI